MLPLGLLNAAQGHPMLVELKNGETLNGHLIQCDTWMNLTLKEVIQTSPDADKFVRLPEVYVKGNNVSVTSCVAVQSHMSRPNGAIRSNTSEYPTRSSTWRRSNNILSKVDSGVVAADTASKEETMVAEVAREAVVVEDEGKEEVGAGVGVREDVKTKG
ncbi:hypothetical protein AAE478_001018 [Parahypoxylon ruwenzoriense]